MGFGDAVNAAYRNYFNFSGRATRAEWWWFFLWYLLLLAVTLAAVLAGLVIVKHSAVAALIMVFMGALLGLVLLGSVVPLYAVQVRRLHDAGQSGMWVLVSALLSLAHSVFWGIQHGHPSPAVDGSALVLALAGLVVNLVILFFLVQPSRDSYSRY
jgi:uncharacterized membrane protein YhaH (DUF805 family)